MFFNAWKSSNPEQIKDHYYSPVHFRKFLKHTNSKVLSSYYIYRSKRYFAKSHYLRTTQEKLSEYFILVPWLTIKKFRKR